MKLLRVISSMHPKSGGPCQGIRNAIPALEKLGVYNEVVCLDDPSSSYIKNDPFVIHAIGPAKGPWGYGASLIPWLSENSTNYDAVIVHGLWQYSSHAVYKSLKKKMGQKGSLPVPYYVMPHGMLDPYFQKAPERKLKAIRNWIYWKLIESKVVNKSNGVLFTCSEELLLARETFRPYKPIKELNVGYGIIAPPVLTQKMSDEFYKTCPELFGKPYFLFLSRIHSKKGLDLLIQSYKKWMDNVADNEIIKLAIAGPGLETQFGQELNKIVENDILLKENIFFTGMLTGDSKWGAFYNSTAFVLPSHQENFGIAIVEALACGKPVLISNKVNIWREIEGEKAGFVSNDTLSGTLELLLHWEKLTPEEKTQMNNNARKTFEKYYAIDPAAKKFKESIE